ncbi:MAG: DHH family phosphoesterase [Pseudobdellovibrio sp.]
MNIRPLLDSAKTIWLSTHKSADGDGLGAEVALYHALKSLNYNVKIIHNDLSPLRYHFLLDGIEILDANKVDRNVFGAQDLALIFDTHDPKLCSPLFGFLQDAGCKTAFIDHHVVFEKKIENVIYHINENASCTGEITLDLIKDLNISLTQTIASCLYTSLVFDTQSFKLQRDSVKVFDMAKELILAGANHNQIYHYLFDNWTINKMNYLSRLINQVSYKNNTIAIICITKSDLKEFNLSTDDVSDLVDLFMSVKNLEASIVVREEAYNYYKLSFRSRTYEILSWAREFGGGGHLYSAGAWVHDSEENIIKKIHAQIDTKKSVAV